MIINLSSSGITAKYAYLELLKVVL